MKFEIWSDFVRQFHPNGHTPFIIYFFFLPNKNLDLRLFIKCSISVVYKMIYFLLTSLQGIPIIVKPSWDDVLRPSTSDNSNRSISSISSHKYSSSGSSNSSSSGSNSVKHSPNDIVESSKRRESDSSVGSTSFGVTISSLTNSSSVVSSKNSEEYLRESSGISDITLSSFTDTTDQSNSNMELNNRDVAPNETQLISRLVAGVGILLCRFVYDSYFLSLFLSISLH